MFICHVLWSVPIRKARDSRVYHMVRFLSKSASALNTNGGMSGLREMTVPGQLPWLKMSTPTDFIKDKNKGIFLIPQPCHSVGMTGALPLWTVSFVPQDPSICSCKDAKQGMDSHSWYGGKGTGANPLNPQRAPPIHRNLILTLRSSLLLLWYLYIIPTS